MPGLSEKMSLGCLVFGQESAVGHQVIGAMAVTKRVYRPFTVLGFDKINRPIAKKLPSVGHHVAINFQNYFAFRFTEVTNLIGVAGELKFDLGGSLARRQAKGE